MSAGRDNRAPAPARLPRRLQRRRVAGWRMPAGAVYVGRPGRYGNPYSPGALVERPGGGFAQGDTAAACVALYAADLARETTADPQAAALMWRRLRGRDLVCWCGLCARHRDGKPAGEACGDCAPCHGDVLLELANGVRRAAGGGGR